MKTIINWFTSQIKIRAKRSWENSKTIHRKALKKNEGKTRLVIAIVFLIVFSWALLQDNILLGLSFLYAGSVAIYAGYIYKGREVMGYVLIGVAIASVIPSLLPSISESYKNADYIGVLILILFGVFMWYISSRLKKGEASDFEESETRKRRPRKRRG